MWRDDDVGRVVYGFGGELGEAGADADRSLDASKERRGVNDDSEAPALEAGLTLVFRFVLELNLFEDIANVVADLSGLFEARVRQRRVVGSRGCEVPFLVRGI